MFVVSAKVLEGSKIFQPLPSLVNSVATIFSYPVAIVKEQAPIYIYILKYNYICIYTQMGSIYAYIYTQYIYKYIGNHVYGSSKKQRGQCQ